MAELQGYQLPDELYYHKEHMWVKIEGEKATVGVTDFYVKLAGEISYVELPSMGDDITMDDVVGTVETGKWIGKIYAPLSGCIDSINEAIDEQPSLPNSDPYGAGWLFTMTLSNPSEIMQLYHGASALDWQQEQIAKHIK